MTATRGGVAESTITDADVAAYLGAARPYANAHPGNGPGAVRAGLRAVLAERGRHPAQVDHSDLELTTDPVRKDRLAAAGWQPIGVCGHVFVLAPPGTDDQP